MLRQVADCNFKARAFFVICLHYKTRPLFRIRKAEHIVLSPEYSTNVADRGPWAQFPAPRDVVHSRVLKALFLFLIADGKTNI